MPKHTDLHHHLPLTSETSLLGLLSSRSPSDQDFDLGKCLNILRILFVTNPKQAAAPAFPSVILGAGGRQLPGHAEAGQPFNAERCRDATSIGASYVCFHGGAFFSHGDKTLTLSIYNLLPFEGFIYLFF